MPRLIASVLILTAQALVPGSPFSGPPARAQESRPQETRTPTIKDRLDQTVSTVIGSPMADVDIDMKHVLDALRKLDPKPIETLSPAEARRQPGPADGLRQLLLDEGANPAPSPDVEARTIAYPGAAGPLAARIYTPVGVPGPLPVVAYFHGGAFVTGSLDGFDATPRALARLAEAVVVSFDYRLAPEARFPAAQDDALSAYAWLRAAARDLGGDPDRIALAGEAAGATLALDTALAARERGLPRPVAIVAIHPVAGAGQPTGSSKANAASRPFGTTALTWSLDNLVSGEADRRDPRLDLLGSADLTGLPPVIVVTAEVDPLRDEGRALADKLKAAGVAVTARDYAGVTHGFFGLARIVAKAREAQEAVARDLKDAFAAVEATGTGSTGADLARLRPGLTVRARDGAALGIVAAVTGGRITLAGAEPEAAVPTDWVAGIAGDAVTLDRDEAAVRATWRRGAPDPRR